MVVVVVVVVAGGGGAPLSVVARAAVGGDGGRAGDAAQDLLSRARSRGQTQVRPCVGQRHDAQLHGSGPGGW